MVGPVVSVSSKVAEVRRTAVSSEERVSVPKKINRLSAESFDPSLKEIRLECPLGTSWGCKAEMDSETHCFRYPLTITQVRPDSVAAYAVVDKKSGLIGLRKGDQIQGWICSTFGDKADYKQVLPRDSYKNTAHGGHILERTVDEETQEMLDSGGSCRIYVRLAPRCTKGCLGEIHEVQDRFDHCLVCVTCGLVQRSSLICAQSEWRNFADDDASELKSRVAVACTSAFTADTRAECARQETVISALRATVRGGAVAGLQLARRPGAGKENEAARREERLGMQEAEARQDICRYCSALGLAEIVRTEALEIFGKVANSSHARLKAGSCIDSYTATVLGSIHVASRVACAPRTIAAILSVADRGTTEKDVGNALKKIKVVYNKPIPPLDPKLLITFLCGHYLQLPVRFELLAQGYVDVIEKKLPTSCPPATIAAVALVYTLSLTAANHGDQDILSRVSKASGVATCTLQTHLSAIEKIDARAL
jgi:transcription initiation factor TFIIIB Brf1 subunit/transcription initiation factor TFIIB